MSINTDFFFFKGVDISRFNIDWNKKTAKLFGENYSLIADFNKFKIKGTVNNKRVDIYMKKVVFTDIIFNVGCNFCITVANIKEEKVLIPVDIWKLRDCISEVILSKLMNNKELISNNYFYENTPKSGSVTHLKVAVCDNTVHIDDVNRAIRYFKENGIETESENCTLNKPYTIKELEELTIPDSESNNKEWYDSIDEFVLQSIHWRDPLTVFKFRGKHYTSDRALVAASEEEALSYIKLLEV